MDVLKIVAIFVVLQITAGTGNAQGGCDLQLLYANDTAFQQCVDDGKVNITTYNMTQQCLTRGSQSAAQKGANRCIFDKKRSCSGIDSLDAYLQLGEANFLGYDLTLERAYEIFCERLLNNCSFDDCDPKNVTDIGYVAGSSFFPHLADMLPQMMKYCNALTCSAAKKSTCPEEVELRRTIYMNEIISTVPGAPNITSASRAYYKKLITDMCPDASEIEVQENCIKTQIGGQEFQDCVMPYKATFGSVNATECRNYNGALDCLNSHVGANCNSNSVDAIMAAAQFADDKLPRDCPVGGAPKLAVSFGIVLAALAYSFL